MNLSLIPDGLERTIAPERLGGERARILQRVDLCIRPGKVLRGRGMTASQREPSANTISEAAVIRTPEGNFVVIDSAGGSVFVTRPDTASGTAAASVRPLW